MDSRRYAKQVARGTSSANAHTRREDSASTPVSSARARHSFRKAPTSEGSTAVTRGPVLIRKADGDTEPFNAEKLHFSLTRTGADRDLIEHVTKEIASGVRDGDRTFDIYRKAFRLLRRSEQHAAARYSLKRAVLDLGPSGYPFEDFVAEILRRKGYAAQTRLIGRGACTTHELDVVAEKDGRRLAAEVKFHNNVGLKSDIKVALYVKARFDDLAAGPDKDGAALFHDRYIITNTKFSSQAESYGACAGLTLVSWSKPNMGNLQDLIEETRVHPLTCLTSLSTAQKRALLAKQIVLCQNIRKDPSVLESLGLSPRLTERVLGETQALCPLD